MSVSEISKPNPTAISVSFYDELLSVTLADGRIIAVPLEWFPRLRNASQEQLAAWRLVGGGIGCAFQRNPATDSNRKRPLIPI
jgi:hypothetical protein